MTKLDLIEQIKAICIELSGQMVEAAHYVINNGDEIPFYSMREIARRANVYRAATFRSADGRPKAFPESTLGAIAIANILAALTISRLSEAARHRIRDNEHFLVDSGEYLLSGRTNSSCREKGS